MSTAVKINRHGLQAQATDRQDRSDADAARPITERLQALLRRIRQVILLRGLLGVAATVVATVLILMGIDTFLVIESTAVRAAVSLAGVASVGSATWWFVIRPLRRRLSLTTVARMVEQHHPELQERVSSAFELLSTPNVERGSRGSEQLIAALAQEASLDVRTFDPRREVQTRTLRPYALTAGALTVLLLAVVALWPHATANLIMRLVAPQRNLDRVQAMSLVVEPNRDIVVPIGSPLTITVRSAGRLLQNPELRHIDSTGREVRHTMQPSAASAESTFAHRIDAVLESFEFRVQDGAALTRTYRVTAVERPKIDWVSARYDYPLYTGLADHTQASVTGPIVVPQGTRLTVSAHCNRAMAKSTARFADKELPGEADPAHWGKRFVWPLDVRTKESVVTLLVEDQHGIQSEPWSMELVGVEDRAPWVDIIEPAPKTLRLKPNDRLSIHYLANEDFGFTGAELLVSVDNSEASSQAIPVPTTDTPALDWCAPQGRPWAGTASLNLAELDLAAAKKVTVRVRVRDNRPAPGGAQEAISRPLEIILDENAELFAVQKIGWHADVFRDTIEAVLAELKSVQPFAEAVAEHVGQPGPIDEATGNMLNTVQDVVHGAARKLDHAGRQFDGTLLDPLVPKLTAAKEPLEKAGPELGQVAQGLDHDQRQKHSETANTKIAEAVEQLEKLLETLPAHKQRLTDLANIEGLLGRQQKVVEDIGSELAQQGPSKESPWRQDEKQIASELAQLDPNQQDSPELPADPSKPSDGDDKSKNSEEPNSENKGNKPGDGKSPSDKPGTGKSDSPGKTPGTGGKPGNGPPSPMGKNDLATAATEAARAGMAPTPGQAQSPAINAAEALASAAAQMSQQLGVPGVAAASPPSLPGTGQPGMPGQPGQPGSQLAQPGSPPGAMGAQGAQPGGAAAAHPGVRVKGTYEDWTRWRGAIRGNAAVGPGEETPSDFRDIVDQYFLSLSRWGAEK